LRSVFGIIGTIIAVVAVIVWIIGGDDPTEPTPPIGPTDTDTSTTATALADLVITNIGADPTPAIVGNGMAALVGGSTYSFELEIANHGQGDVGGNVLARMDWGCNLQTGSGVLGGSNLTTSVGSLAAGETKLAPGISVTLPAGTGTCTVWFKVDPDDVFAESDESELSNVWETEMVLQ